MNKKVLVIAVALMAVAMLATPLFGTAEACGHRGRCGKRTEKILVDIGPKMGSDVPKPVVSLPEVRVCGNVQIGRGGTTYYPEPSYGISEKGVAPLLVGGSSLWTLNYIINLNNMKGVVRYNVVITFPGGTYTGEFPEGSGEYLTLEVPKGTFEGTVTLFGEFRLYGSPVDPKPLPMHYNGYRYGVLRGTDEYKGWKLVISGETSPNEQGIPVSNLEMYLYKPLP